MRKPLALALILALAACSAEPIVIQDAGNIVELTGGPASNSNTAESVAFHQPHAAGLCRARGYADAEFAGEKEILGMGSQMFRCVPD